MNKVKIKFPATNIQLFFIEKTYELLNKSTIDSYRLRLHNPKSLIKELVNVADDLINHRLKNNEYAKTLCQELTRLIEEPDCHLRFTTIDKAYYRTIINPKSLSTITLKKIITTSGIILNDNRDYFIDLSKIILKKILHLSSGHSDLNHSDYSAINNAIQYFYLELYYQGYSKYYLRDFTMAIFTGVSGLTFYQRFAIIKSLYSRQSELYTVVMCGDSNTLNSNSFALLDNNFKILDKAARTRLSVISNPEVEKYLDNNKTHVLFAYQCHVQDYYSALIKAKEDILKAIDIYHLSVSNKNLQLLDKCVVIGTINPTKGRVYETNYVIDGHYNAKMKVYKELASKLTIIQEDQSIELEAKNKLNAGLRYLRLGGEAKDLGNQLMNYWIGIEFIFSIHDANSHTYGRIKEMFPLCHGLIYAKRNFGELHKELRKAGFSLAQRPEATDLRYLLDEQTYILINNEISSPLLKFRCSDYLKLISDRKRIYNMVMKHRQNIEWNIARIYRLRNEIVHNASITSEIEIIVSHVRYYLTFMLNSIIDFFTVHGRDINSNGKIDLEDYFTIQSLSIENIEHTKSYSDFILKVRTPYENLITT